jgi:hypothetical protein
MVQPAAALVVAGVLILSVAETASAAAPLKQTGPRGDVLDRRRREHDRRRRRGGDPLGVPVVRLYAGRGLQRRQGGHQALRAVPMKPGAACEGQSKSGSGCLRTAHATTLSRSSLDAAYAEAVGSIPTRRIYRPHRSAEPAFLHRSSAPGTSGLFAWCLPRCLPRERRSSVAQSAHSEPSSKAETSIPPWVAQSVCTATRSRHRRGTVSGPTRSRRQSRGHPNTGWR